MLRRFVVILLALYVAPLRAETETEKGPVPRIYADFDVGEYVGPGKAKTTTIVPRAVVQTAKKVPAYLGVQFEPSGGGLRVVQIDSQSPAAKAGLKTGDIVKKLDGKGLAALAALRDTITAKAAGDKVAFKVERAGKEEEVSVTLAAVSIPMTGTNAGPPRAIIGIQAAPGDKGMKITSVTANMPGDKAGLKVDDIILEIGGKTTAEMERLTEATRDKKPGDKLMLVIRRGKDEMRKEVTLVPEEIRGGRPNLDWNTREGNLFRKPVYRLAVIPLSFPDTAINSKITPKHWEDALFSSESYNSKNAFDQVVYGSMNDYYREISCGSFRVEGKCFEPITVAKNRADYANMAARTTLLTEAIDAVRKRDGKEALKGFDGICYIYAGRSAATQRGGLFWPHKSNFSHQGEGWSYFIVPEGGTRMSNISTISHEFGHMLGLPDLYAKPEVPEMEGVGGWCAMSQQNRNGRPQHFCAWAKDRLGWLKPTIIDPDVPQKLILSPIEGTRDQCFKVLVNPDGSEYFLLENRLKTGFDKDLAGEGLLIWRVVDGTVTLEESHGITGRGGPNAFETAVPFPSKANTAFTPITTPSSKPVKQEGKKVWITNIRRLPDNRITFQIGYEYF